MYWYICKSSRDIWQLEVGMGWEFLVFFISSGDTEETGQGLEIQSNQVIIVHFISLEFRSHCANNTIVILLQMRDINKVLSRDPQKKTQHGSLLVQKTDGSGFFSFKFQGLKHRVKDILQFGSILFLQVNLALFWFLFLDQPWTLWI